MKEKVKINCKECVFYDEVIKQKNIKIKELQKKLKYSINDELKSKIDKLESYILDTRNLLNTIIVSSSRPVATTTRKECYKVLEDLQNIYCLKINSLPDKEFLKKIEGEE